MKLLVLIEQSTTPPSTVSCNHRIRCQLNDFEIRGAGQKSPPAGGACALTHVLVHLFQLLRFFAAVAVPIAGLSFCLQMDGDNEDPRYRWEE